METYISGNPKLAPNPLPVKVHATLCSQLAKLLEKINSILPAIESARPGSTQGLKTLCLINCSIGKGNSIIQHCADCSKLYLALTGERILGRCERLRSSVTQSLSLIQNMVPLVLADQVSEVINYLNNIKFAIDPREEAAGKAISQLLHQVDSTDEIKSNTLQKAASSLNLTSRKTLLIEKRSIKRLLDQVIGRDPDKEHVLNFLSDLLEKHAKNIKPVDMPVDIKIEENPSDHEDECLTTMCWEKKNENNEMPFKNDFKGQNEEFLQVLFPWNVDYVKTGSFYGFSPGKFVNFFKDLAELGSEKRKKAVEDVVVLLERDVDTCYLMLSKGFGEALIEFLTMSDQLSGAIAQEVGAQLFLAYLRNNRVEFPTFSEEILRIVAPFLDAETTEALALLPKFSQCLNTTSFSLSKKLSSDDINILEICMEIVCDLSSQDNTKSQIFSSGYLKALVSILSYEKLAECSLKVLQIFSFSEEGAQLIGRNPKFISCLVEFLETSTTDEKEIAVSILYSICSLRHENCLVVRDQFVVPPLVNLSVNGTEVAMEMSKKLLQLLRDLRDDDNELTMGSGTVGTCKHEHLVYKTSPILPKKKGVFARFRSLAHF
ncbi:ARM repeat superfamily protein [Rhynchospora pubera]|uniref:ARM repeat superfamily protein n=1 Tax=Rhynchospora pubera TaxID=906938 RepID=A0AAV8GZH0_9POAL|nr:ARM repeat superfamily protein [Rhynchospora pubera]